MPKRIQSIQKEITKKFPSVAVTLERNCVVLRGELDSWEDVVEAGTLAVSKRYFGVVNDIHLKGFCEEPAVPPVEDLLHDGQKPDVLVIGGGVTGAAIARALTKYQLDVMLIEKEYDVATGASSRNDGDVHVGIDLHAGQQKLHYNGRGNEMFDVLSADLNVKFERTGHIVIFYKRWERILMAPLMRLKAKLFGIKGVRYLNREQLLKKEPGLPSWAIGGIFMASGGEISPYKFTVALAENAAENGAKICLNTMVKGMRLEGDCVTAVLTNRGTIYPKLVVNAAGVYADRIAEMAGDRTFTIHPRKGTNLILDKKCKAYAATSMNKSPFSKFADEKVRTNDAKKHTKGGGIVHTVDNNVLVGPTAVETPYREDNSTDRESVEFLFKKLTRVAEGMKPSDVITYFSGTRAATYEEDFVVRKGIFTKNVIEAAGIQSPGLGSAPAIAEDVAKWASELLGGVSLNKHYNPKRKTYPHLAELPEDERNACILQNPLYGEIVCRCEEISKGEILDALHSPVPVYSLDAIKRRVRPGMGRCQGGFCSPLVLAILAEHAGKALEEIPKAGAKSTVLFGDTKGGGHA